MRIVAFDIRAAGPRPYSHAIVDMGAVVLEDGEIIDQHHALAGENRYLDIRPCTLEEYRVQWRDVRAAGNYHRNVGDLIAFLDAHRGFAPAWAFDAGQKAAYVIQSLRYSSSETGFDRVADVCGLQSAMTALGASPGVAPTSEAICHRLGLPLIDPTTSALDRARIAGTAAAMLDDELRRHYSPTERKDRGNLMPVALPFDPFGDAPPTGPQRGED